MNKLLSGLVALGIAGLLSWCLISTHATMVQFGVTRGEMRGDLRVVKQAIEFHHTTPLVLDLEDAAMLAGYAVNPEAGLNACVGGVTTVLPLLRRDPEQAEVKLIDLLSYLTGRRCSVRDNAVECR